MSPIHFHLAAIIPMILGIVILGIGLFALATPIGMFVCLGGGLIVMYGCEVHTRNIQYLRRHYKG